jgi:hypothetical protein
MNFDNNKVMNTNILGIRKNYNTYFADKFKKFEKKLIKLGREKKAEAKKTIRLMKMHFINQVKESNGKSNYLYNLYENLESILEESWSKMFSNGEVSRDMDVKKNVINLNWIEFMDQYISQEIMNLYKINQLKWSNLEQF